MAEPPEHRPESAAPVGGIYEQFNIFGRATGIRVTVAEGHPLPAAPHGHYWTWAAALPDVSPSGEHTVEGSSAEGEVPERYSAAYWRARAEEARTIADEMRHAETRRKMLDIAAGYLSLAEWTEKQDGEAANPTSEEDVA